MYILRLLTVFMCVALFSCKGPTTEVQGEILQSDEVVELDSTFIKFYNRFHSDSLYQLAHVQFPIDKNSQGLSGDKWDKENWIIHNQFTDMGGMFKRDLTPIGSMVVEKIIDANGFFEMERRFAELSDGWKLIYYDVRNPSQQNKNEEQN